MSVITTLEADASKALAWFAKADAAVVKLSPTAVAALGTILGAVGAALAKVEGAAASDGLNIALDVSAVTSLKAVWSQVEAAAADFGVKL